MSKLFFDDLEIPRPDINLEVGSGTHAGQTAEIMKRFEPVLMKEKPDYTLVVGDVNSTIGCALTAAKLGVKIIHVEAGLRSFDRSMPEEINRVLTDALADILFTTEKGAEDNLLREGIQKEKIFFVGNVMIDTLLRHRERAKNSDILFRLGLADSKPENHGGCPLPYALVTLHRPSNVDNREKFSEILEGLSAVARELPIIFPIHPRTMQRVVDYELHAFLRNGEGKKGNAQGIFLIQPLGYLDFLHLMANAELVLTDSGGIQEETTVLGIPCITLRENTERPVTVSEGTNRIVGTDKQEIIRESITALHNGAKSYRIPELWDGRAAERIVEGIIANFSS
jgi:UDP-N-acetylglucosamine 2-epimerase (non-hydrolysing)